MSNEWVLVPREPTAKQLVDGAYEVPDPISHRGELTARMVYRAMLDAAPAAPAMTDAEMTAATERDEAEQERAHTAYLRGIADGKAAAPASREDMAAFSAELKADPAKAQAFFQAAGIIDSDGNLTPQYGGQEQDAVRGRPVTAEMHAIVGLNDSLVDLHSRLDSVTAGLAQARTAERRLREALKPFAAIDLTTNQAVDAMDVLRARRALEGK